MTKLLVVVTVLAATLAGQGAAPFVGDWEGVATLDGGTWLYVLITFERAGRGTVAKVRLGNPAAAPSPAKVAIEGRKVRLDLGLGGRFDGALEDGGAPRLAGEWASGAQRVPLTFVRTLALRVDLVHEPKPPLPYPTEDAVVPGGAPGVRLAGTFARPNGRGPFPAVVFLHGFGAYDRDERVGDARPFYALSHALALAGVASFRFDKRGFGGSTGDWVGASPATLAADGVAAAHWLRARPDVDPARVAYVGHSEGGLLALLAAGADPAAAAAVAFAPPMLGGPAHCTSVLDAALGGAGANPFAAFLGRAAVARIAKT
ncbi:MAG TPA: alpha/beta fold hydrolase [Planctomycetota bacterium]|nr:alpha/beta fold hydrolase [Planctomycetota bacterium]